MDIDPKKLQPSSSGEWVLENALLVSHAVIYVSVARRVRDGRFVTLEEVLATPDPNGREWTSPEELEALKAILSSQRLELWRHS